MQHANSTSITSTPVLAQNQAVDTTVLAAELVPAPASAVIANNVHDDYSRSDYPNLGRLHVVGTLHAVSSRSCV